MSHTAVFVREKHTLGDHIVVYPLLHALHRCFPESPLKVVGSHDASRFYKLLPWPVDYIQSSVFRDDVKALGRNAHAMVALPCSSERYGILASVCRPTLRLGYRNRRIFDFAWTHSCNRSEDDYRGLTYLRLLNTVMPVDPEINARECFHRLAESCAVPSLRSDVVFMPGGGLGAYKRWRLAHYLALMGLIERQVWADRHRDPAAIQREFLGDKGRGWLLRWLPSRAHDNGLFLIFSNGVGIDDDEVRTGNAMILDPYGRILAETSAAADAMVVADLDASLLEYATGRLWIRARRPELYGPLTQRTGQERSTREIKFQQ